MFKKTIRTVLILFFIFCININFAFALGPLKDYGPMVGQVDKAADKGGFDTTVVGDGIGVIAANLIKAFLSILGIIFLILIVYGGYIWMMSRGNEQEVEKAKQIIQRAIIGLIIIVAAYVITVFVFSGLEGSMQ